MKTPQEYIKNNIHSLEEGVSTVDLLNLIEYVQIDAYEQGVDNTRSLSKSKFLAGESGYIDDESARILKYQFKTKT